MKRINKGTRLIYHFFVLFILILLVDSELTPMSSPFKIYEPLLGENRDVGEILDSTLTQNPRLI